MYMCVCVCVCVSIIQSGCSFVTIIICWVLLVQQLYGCVLCLPRSIAPTFAAHTTAEMSSGIHEVCWNMTKLGYFIIKAWTMIVLPLLPWNTAFHLSSCMFSYIWVSFSIWLLVFSRWMLRLQLREEDCIDLSQYNDSRKHYYLSFFVNKILKYMIM